MNSKYIVLIPAYNSQSKICDLLLRIQYICKDCLIIVVDDGSTDETANILKKHPGIKYLTNKNNLGKGASLQNGLNYIFQHHSQSSAVVFIDSDLQHEPERIPDFIEAFEKGRGCFILGKREFVLQKMPLARIVSNFITSALLSLKIKCRIYDSQCGFRLVSLKVLKVCGPFETKKYEFETELLIKAAKQGASFYTIEIPTIYNDEISYIKGFRDTFAFIKAFIKY